MQQNQRLLLSDPSCPQSPVSLSHSEPGEITSIHSSGSPFDVDPAETNRLKQLRDEFSGRGRKTLIVDDDAELAGPNLAD